MSRDDESTDEWKSIDNRSLDKAATQQRISIEKTVLPKGMKMPWPTNAGQTCRLTDRPLVRYVLAYGEVAERLNAPVLKTGKGLRPSWVRIPPSPPYPNIPLNQPVILISGSLCPICAHWRPTRRLAECGKIFRWRPAAWPPHLRRLLGMNTADTRQENPQPAGYMTVGT